MQYVQVTPDMTLSDLIDIVGEQNVDAILQANNLSRCVRIGEVLEEHRRNTPSNIDYVNWQQKKHILDGMTGDSDVFEKAALGDTQDWNYLNMYGSFPGYLRIPEDIVIKAESDDILGNGRAISNQIYDQVMDSLKNTGAIDPSIFSEYDTVNSTKYGTNAYGGELGYDAITRDAVRNNPFEWFKLPWGKISLYSSISDELVDFPVYPEEISDGYTANYDEMPQMLYQYEPWKVYKSSGPRTNSYKFKMHRDMWTGDHRDGLANRLVRFCESNCFPQYRGSYVNVPTVTLYMNTENLITGVLTECKVDWQGPLGLDDFYLELELTLTITEVSKTPLNYTTVKNKGLVS